VFVWSTFDDLEQEREAVLAGALTSSRNSLAIIDRLAKSDPGNTGWQRDLAVSNAKIGDTFKKMGNGVEASDALGRGRVVMVRLAGLSPDNAGWKGDLAWFEARIAELSQ
jgi:hypothetical protein